MDIMAVGELLIDFTPIQHETGLYFQPNPGGAPCNMLAMAQALGSQTMFVGKVGEDRFGHQLKRTLMEKKINTDHLVLSETEPTTLAFVHLDEAGDRSFSFYRKGCADVGLKLSEVDLKTIESVSCLHFGSLSFTDEPSKSTVLEMLKYAKKCGKQISYDPNYRPALWSSEKKALEGMKMGLTFADILKVSDEEALLLTQEKNIESAAEKLFESGIAMVLVTLGAKGCYYCYAKGCGYVKGFESKVVDTTGAGDAFFGACVHQLINHDLKNIEKSTLEELLSFSNACASLVVESFGGIPSIPTKERAMARFKEI